MEEEGEYKRKTRDQLDKAPIMGPRKKRMKCPSTAEQLKIKRTLGLKRYDKFPKCPCRSNKRMEKAKLAGEMCEDCMKPGKSPCEKCRCTRIAGSGTEHYGVGFCYDHEGGRRRKVADHFAKNHAIAMQQGYPLKPVRYKSANEILVDIQEDEVEARAKMSTMAELDMLRSKMQELESKLYEREEKPTVYKNGKLMDASDEDVINMVTKLAKGIGDLAKINLDVTEQDYIHINEIKLWLSAVVNMTRAEFKDGDSFEQWLRKFMEIPQPQAGRQGAKS